MDVTCKVAIYEIDGSEEGLGQPELLVQTHWNSTTKVNLMFQGKQITVVAVDLHKAIDNAMNV